MLYKVILPNDYFKVGAFVEGGDDGMVQEIWFETVNGRLIPGGFKGLYVPLSRVRPYVFAVLKRGFDDQGAHAEYRGAYRARDMRSESRRMEDELWAELSGDDPLLDDVEARSRTRN